MVSESNTTTGKLEVVLSPALLPFYEVRDKVVVMIDILRAGTSICVAFQHGVKRILPVATPEEAMLFRDFDFIIAAERNAVKLDGFDLGNSPFEYENIFIQDRNIAFTTTNGTKAIKLARELGAGEILIGSFLNLTALCDKLNSLKGKSVLLLCAGWKDKVNLEDTLFAGAVTKKLLSHYQISCDAAKTALMVFDHTSDHLKEVIYNSSHATRFKTLHGNTDDVAYCLQTDTLKLVPYLSGEYLVCDPSPIQASRSTI
jgi:2-phosphosulfolactate phosphatase